MRARISILGSATISLLLVVAGCDKPKSDNATGAKAGDKVASCYAAELGSCREYNADNLALGSASVAKLCNVLVKTAVFSMTACPTAGVTVSCATSEDKDYYYASYPFPLADIEKDCKRQDGTFTRGK